MAVGLISMVAVAERLVIETSDFSGGGVPDGWIVADGGYLSPEYSNAVSRIELSYGATGEQAGTAQLFAIAHGNGGEVQIASVNTFTTGAAFDFPESSDYRRFRIATNGMALASFSATWLDARRDAPANVAATALTTDSIEVSWAALEGANGYRVSIWTNALIGASAGTIMWEDTLPGATNGASSTRMSDAKFDNCFANAGWTRSDKAGYPTGEDGTIRIGITDTAGWVQTPPIVASGAGMAVRFSAKAVASNAQSMSMTVERISGGVAHVAGTVELSTEMKELCVPVPDWSSGDGIRLNSLAAGDCRTVIGAVALVSGYSAGTSSSVMVREVSVANVESCVVDGLPPSATVFVGVAAIEPNGTLSLMSPGVEVDLANPPLRATLNACPLQTLGNHLYGQNFDGLSNVVNTTSGSPWLDGVTLPYFQAWQDGEAPTNVCYYAGGNSTGAKFLCLAANSADTVRAFGARTRLGTTMAWGMAFTNNAATAMFLNRVSYSAQQWGFANTVGHPLVFSCMVTNRLDWMASWTDGWTVCSETAAQCLKDVQHDTPVVTPVEYVPAERMRIEPGQVLYLRWTLPPPGSGNSAVMAIDDLAVEFESVARPTLIQIVRSGE